ncbi:MAG: hypothetical protein O2841_04965 [Actinomycetota bacterium]|nr:hypothetical protein [Actinomycetota bacterium]
MVLPAYLNVLSPFKTELIRVGVPRDGGYAVNPKALRDAKSCVTFGLGMDWSFEKELHTSFSISKIVVYDGTVSFWTYLKRAIGIFGRMIIFQEKPRALAYAVVRQFIGYLVLFRGAAKHEKKMVVVAPCQENEIGIDEVFRGISDPMTMITKIDIEGGEYQLIDKLLNSVEFRKSLLIIMEWHDTFEKREEFLRFVNAMLETHYLIHLVGNSGTGLATDGLPEVLEITWQHKNFELLTERVKNLPIDGIDFPNGESRGLYALEFEN